MTSPTDLPGMAEIPTPVTFDRLHPMLDQGWTIDEDAGTARCRFPQAEIVVTAPQEPSPLLLIRGVRIGEPIPNERRAAVEAFANDWHRQRIWPTLTVRTTEQGVRLHAHLGVDVAAGLTTAQVAEYLRLGLGTMRQCFTALGESTIGKAGSAESDAG